MSNHVDEVDGGSICPSCEARRVLSAADLTGQHTTLDAKLLSRQQVSSLLRLAVRVALGRLLGTLLKRI